MSKMNSVLNGISKVSPAISAASGCANIVGTVFSIMESQKTAEFQNELLEYQKKLVGQLQEVNGHLANIETELSNIREELNEIKQVLKDIDASLKDAEINKCFTSIKSWVDRINSLDPNVHDEKAFKRLANEILDAGNDNSVLWNMNQIHSILVNKIFSANSSLEGKLSPSAFLYIRAKLVQGLHLLAFGCAYTGNDYGYFFKEWSQNFYEQMKIMLEYGEKTGSTSSLRYKDRWNYDGTQYFRPILSIDSLALIPILDPDPPIDLRVKDTKGNYQIAFKDLDENEKKWWQKNKLSEGANHSHLYFGYPHESFTGLAKQEITRHDEYGKVNGEHWLYRPYLGKVLDDGYLYSIDLTPNKPEEDIQSWHAAFKKDDLPGHHLDRFGFTQWDTSPMVSFDEHKTIASDHIFLSFAHRRQAGVIYLGSVDGQSNWIDELDNTNTNCFFIYDGTEKNQLLTYDKNFTISLKSLSELTSLTPALWQLHPISIRGLSSVILIQPVTIETPNKHVLSLDTNGDWIVSLSDDYPEIGFVTNVSSDEQQLKNPYKMKPVWVELTQGDKSKKVIFHKSPFIP